MYAGKDGEKSILVVLTVILIIISLSTTNILAAPATSTSCGDVRTSLTLTANVSAASVTHDNPGTCFIINGSNLFLDGGMFSVVGNVSGIGINITLGVNNVTIRNFGRIHNFSFGISALLMNNSFIVNNTIRNNTIHGISLESSGNNVIANNTIFNNTGRSLMINSSSNSNNITNNTIRNNLNVLLLNSSGNVFLNNSVFEDGFILANSTGNVFANNTLDGSGIAFDVNQGSDGNVFRDNTIANYATGIDITSSDRNNITWNTINSNNRAVEISITIGTNVSYNRIVDLGAEGSGIRLDSSISASIFRNGINGQADGTVGISLSSGSNYSSVLFNNISDLDPNALAIEITTRSAFNNITGNTIDGSDITGIDLRGPHRNDLLSNNITVKGTGYGINLVGNNDSHIESNTINTSNFESYGIFLQFYSSNNTFMNNNITSRTNDFAIYDTGSTLGNNFIYNNSLGEVRWTNNGTGSFLNNLSINVTNDQGIGLGRNLFIENNTIALNTSAFGVTPRINSSANLTLRGLTFRDFDQMRRVQNYTTSAAQIRTAGINCDEDTCQNLSYDATNGILIFNTTTFSSFSMHDGTNPLVINFWMNGTNGSNFSSSLVNKLIFNATVNDTHSIMDTVLFGFSNGNGTAFNFTGTINFTLYSTELDTSSVTDGLYTVQIYANDTSSNLNNTVSNISFTLDRVPPNITYLFINVTNQSGYTTNFTRGGVIRINATVNDTTTYVKNVTFSVRSANTTNTEFNLTTNRTDWVWFTDLALSTVRDGIYYVSVYANDTLDNFNGSAGSYSNFTAFVVDQTPPNITYLRVNVTNASGYTTNFTRGGVIRINATINDTTTYVTNVTFGIRSANTTNTEFNLTTNRTDWVWFTDLALSTVSDGIYYVMVYANDTLNNFNGSNANFTAFVVDGTAPNVTTFGMSNLTNASNVSGDIILFNISINDTTTFAKSASLGLTNNFRNGTEFNVTLARNFSGFHTALILSTMTDGFYTVRVYANDSVDNVNNTVANISFTLDRTPPNVTQFLLNDSFGVLNASNFTNGGVVAFNLTINDSTLTVETVKVGLTNDFRNGTEFNITLPRNFSGYHAAVPFNTLTDGFYTLKVYANDTLGNTNNTVANLSFRVDSTPPNVSNFWMNATNGVTFSSASGTIQFNGTINDSTTAVQTVRFGFTNSLNSSQFNVTALRNESGGIYHHLLQLNTLSCGTYTARTYANDTLGNVNNSVANLTFIITCAEANPGGGNPSGFSTSTTTPSTTTTTTTPSTSETSTETSPSTTPSTTPTTVSVTSVTSSSASTTGDSTAGSPAGRSSIIQTERLEVSITNNEKVELLVKPRIKEDLPTFPLEEKYEAIVRSNLARKNILGEQQEQKLKEEIDTLKRIEKQKANYLFGKAFSFGFMLPKQDYSISGITYSKDQIRGKLLRSELQEVEELIIPPGQTITKQISVRRGLSLEPAAVTLTFSSQEGLLSTNSLPEASSAVGGAIDIDNQENIFEVYFLIPPSVKKTQTIDKYSFEFAVDEAGSTSRLRRLDPKYSESFGSYAIKSEEGFLFIQQFAYDESRYQGEHIFTMKLFEDGRLIAQQQYNLAMG